MRLTFTIDIDCGCEPPHTDPDASDENCHEFYDETYNRTVEFLDELKDEVDLSPKKFVRKYGSVSPRPGWSGYEYDDNNNGGK